MMVNVHAAENGLPRARLLPHQRAYKSCGECTGGLSGQGCGRLEGAGRTERIARAGSLNCPSAKSSQ
jgi:hypothetical protein